jgi:autotransporter translocation and assembly factor TamB
VKKLIKITTSLILIFLLVLIASVLLIYATGWWKGIFSHYLTRSLEQKYRLSLQYKALHSDLFSNLTLIEPNLVTLEGTSIFSAGTIHLEYRLRSLFNQDHLLDALLLDDLALVYPNGVDTLMAHLKISPDTSQAFALSISKLIVKNVAIATADTHKIPFIREGFLQGRLTFRQGLDLVCDTASLSLPQYEENLQFRELKLLTQNGKLIIEQGELRNRSSNLVLRGELQFEPIFQGRLHFQLKNLRANERLPEHFTLLSESDFINLQGEIEATRERVNLSASFNGQLRERAVQAGKIQAILAGKYLQVPQLSCRIGAEKITGTLKGDLDRGLNAVFSFWHLNTHAWGLTRQKTDLSGAVNIQTKGKITAPQLVTARFDLNESSFETFDFNYIKGALEYKNGFLTVVDTMLFKLGETELAIDGLVGLHDSTIDARLYFDGLEASLVGEWLEFPSLEGKLDGFVEAIGNLYAPDLRGWVKGYQFGLPNLTFQEGIARFGLINLRKERFGDIYIEALNARTPLIRDEIPLASVILRMDGDTILVRLLKIVSDYLNIEARGKIAHLQEVILQDLKIQRGPNTLANVNPICFILDQDTIQLNRVPFLLNQGRVILSSQIAGRQIKHVNLEAGNVTLDFLNDLVQSKFGISGKLNGSLEYQLLKSGPIVKGNLKIDNFKIYGAAFKELAVDAVLTGSRFQIGNLALQDNQGGVVQARGTVGVHLLETLRQPFIGNDTINLNIDFENFSPADYVKLLPQIRKIEGKLTGTLLAYQTLGAPRFSYDLTVSKPNFQALKAQELRLKGIYQDNRLSFTELALSDDGGTLRGRGFVGCEFRLVPLTMTFPPESPVSMNFTMHSTNLLIVSDYLNDVESLTGVFDLALSVSGTNAHPIRAGNFSAKNATLVIASLENPVTGINGSAIIQHNILDIVTMSGYMKKPIKPTGVERFQDKLKAYTWDILFPPKIAPDEPNLNVSGTIDLTQFFAPRYDLILKGEEVYIRTILAEQEGTFNAQIRVKGRDTLAIEGDVEIIDFVLRNEFTEGPKVALNSTSTSRSFKTVNLYTEIPGNFYFQNSQLDCELEGEIWITQAGGEPYRFAGTLDVRRGKFFYLGWEFELLNGTIEFEPTEFNPILDIEAQVDLATYGLEDTTVTRARGTSEYATVKLTGYLDDPTLTLESANFSQSDILMLLSYAQGVTGQGSTQDYVSSGALNVFGRYFERQLEKNITRYSGLDQFELRTRGNLLTAQSGDQWSILLGRKIAPNLYVRYERTFNLTEPYQQYGLEYRLSRNMSLIGDIDQDGLFRVNYNLKFRY